MKARLDRIRTGPDAGNVRLRIELTGPHEIFRFLVNMLDDQVEFARVGRLKLTSLRRQLRGDRFDPWARQLLGDHRHDRLCRAWGIRPRPDRIKTVRTTGGVL